MFSFGRFPYLSRTHFRKKFYRNIESFFWALKVTEIFKFLRAISPAGQILSDIWHFFSCEVRKGHHSKARSIESIYSAIEDYWYEYNIYMSSSEEFSDTSGEEYLSDDSECLDFLHDVLFLHHAPYLDTFGRVGD